jgi:hypothetical protein
LSTEQVGGLQLSKIPFNGRSLNEYCAIFGFDPEFLKGKTILDVAGGPSSFTAEASPYCRNAVACDPSYGHSSDVLLKTGMNDIADIRQKIEPVLDLYKWDFYKNPESLRAIREEVLNRFVAKYVKAELPRLPFADNSFDLVLCSHFLFLFAGWLGYDFHLESIKELARVGDDEIRIFPLVGLDAKPYDEMNALIDDIKRSGLTIEILPVAFEFQRGANQALIIKR